MKDKYRVHKAFLFIGFVPRYKGLYKSLERDGYNLVFKPTLVLPDGTTKGNVDAELVLHAMIEYQNYEKAVIVSGDGDYHCLVEHLRENNKLLRLIIPNRFEYSSLLRKFAHESSYMNGLKEKLEYKKP